MTKFIDLSVTMSSKGHLRNQPKIQYIKHDESAALLAPAWGLKPSDFDLRDDLYCAIETVTAQTHATTHVDAPWHFGPTSEGKPAKTVDQISLEWCYGNGVVLDFHHKKRGEEITPSEVEHALNKIEYQLKPLDIVLVRTDVYKHYGEPDYENMHPGMTRGSTLWLIDHGIRMMGIDAFGWDRPHDVMVSEIKAGIKGRFIECHYLGIEREYCHMERLANLDKIPRPHGFKVAAFPIKIEGASGAWLRAVAIIED